MNGKNPHRESGPCRDCEVFLCQNFAKLALADERPAKIINIASLLSFQGGVRVASYTSAKSGLDGLTRLMANEWAAQGINVNAITPGYV